MQSKIVATSVARLTCSRFGCVWWYTSQPPTRSSTPFPSRSRRPGSHRDGNRNRTIVAFVPAIPSSARENFDPASEYANNPRCESKSRSTNPRTSSRAYRPMPSRLISAGR
jgi:hypothetical protein